MATKTMNVDAALKDLIRFSNSTGSDPRLVQGGGGNTSAKTADGKYMYIKASGTALKDMNPSRGYRRMKLAEVKALLRDDSLLALETYTRENTIVNRLLAACEDTMPSQSRPSVEAHLHAILNRYVIHLHPQVVNGFVNAINGQKELNRLFKDNPPLWVPYTDPGFLLARRMAQLVEDYRQQHGVIPAVAFLEKHGIFVSANNPQQAVKLVHQTIAKLEKRVAIKRAPKLKATDPAQVRQAMMTIRQALFQVTGQYRLVRHYTNDTVANFLACKQPAQLLAAGAMSPDELVYANGAPVWVDSMDAAKLAGKLQKQKDQGRKVAASFVVPGLGLFVTGDAQTIGTIAEVAEASLYARRCASQLGGFKALTTREADFINKWESESYRQQLVGGRGGNELQNRVAIVTGAGSGLGRGIALGLARSGALVAVADIDINAAVETVEMIQKERPQAQAVAVHCNVTDEESVAASFDELVDLWGGLDILVNAAGVAPAYSLMDLPVDKWRFALEVNLTGYFLMAKYAARTMIAQGMGGSIINLSSKSGLDASKNNTPYNATKAGELHMARGWAMELGGHGIRVNCVCPGNVFEGSKIWNPEYIKVCAKKNGIRPEEVIPFYVNKTILKREIKGQDIADAVVFLCSDKARTVTGQTLVADSGQVMVR